MHIFLHCFRIFHSPWFPASPPRQKYPLNLFGRRNARSVMVASLHRAAIGATLILKQKILGETFSTVKWQVMKKLRWFFLGRVYPFFLVPRLQNKPIFIVYIYICIINYNYTYQVLKTKSLVSSFWRKCITQKYIRIKDKATMYQVSFLTN